MDRDQNYKKLSRIIFKNYLTRKNKIFLISRMITFNCSSWINKMFWHSSKIFSKIIPIVLKIVRRG